jgi:hypothetical protein
MKKEAILKIRNHKKDIINHLSQLIDIWDGYYEACYLSNNNMSIQFELKDIDQYTKIFRALKLLTEKSL